MCLVKICKHEYKLKRTGLMQNKGPLKAQIESILFSSWTSLFTPFSSREKASEREGMISSG